MTHSNQLKIDLIQEGFKLIQQSRAYSQADIVKKLNHLKYPTSRSTFNKILRNAKVSNKALHIFFTGFQSLLKQEIGVQLNDDMQWIKIEGYDISVIPMEHESPQSKGFNFHFEGRLELKNKIKSYQQATTEIYEVGLTLNTFSRYFESRKSTEFKEPIIALLKKGVNIKCYLLDPEWNGTKLYFSDREQVLKESLSGVEKIRNTLRNLKPILEELKSLQLKGILEIFTYRHIPHNYFLAIDPNLPSQASMVISNYLFGLRRAKCPVFEFSRQDQPILFNRYQESLNRLISNARKVDFTTISL